MTQEGYFLPRWFIWAGSIIACVAIYFSNMQLKAISERFDTINSSVAAAVEKIGNVEKTTIRIDSQLTGLTEARADMRQLMLVIDTKVEDNEGRISVLEVELQNLKTLLGDRP
jgi:chromosome segregation ATPase